MYFDRDGIVVEASATKTDGYRRLRESILTRWYFTRRFRLKIRMFSGNSFHYPDPFKYGLSADKIYFDDAEK